MSGRINNYLMSKTIEKSTRNNAPITEALTMGLYEDKTYSVKITEGKDTTYVKCDSKSHQTEVYNNLASGK